MVQTVNSVCLIATELTDEECCVSLLVYFLKLSANCTSVF